MYIAVYLLCDPVDKGISAEVTGDVSTRYFEQVKISTDIPRLPDISLLFLYWQKLQLREFVWVCFVY